MKSMHFRSTAARVAALAGLLVVAGLVAWGLRGPLGGASANPVPEDLTIDKSCFSNSGIPEGAVGDIVIYRYDIANVGAETLDRVSVVDDVIGNVTGSFPASLDPSESDTVQFFRQIQESDPRPLVNEVTAIYETAAQVQMQATDTCEIDVLHITVEKEASLSGGLFTFEFTITNDGSTPLALIKAIDTTLGIITEEFPENLAIGQSETVILTKLRLPGDPLCNSIEVTYGHFLPGSVTQVKGRADDCAEEVTPTPTPTDTATPTDTVTPTPTDTVTPTPTDTVTPTPTDTVTPTPTDTVTPTPTDTVTPTPTDTVTPTPTDTVTPTPTDTVTVTPTPPTGEGCTPGFWKGRNNGRLLWDEATDPIPIAIGAALGIAPVTTSSDFYAVFMVAPGTAGLPVPLTMLEAAQLGGGHAKKLARHGVAALLNAAGVNYPFTVLQVKSMVRAALLTGEFEPLATSLDTANNAGCPF